MMKIVKNGDTKNIEEENNVDDDDERKERDRGGKCVSLYTLANPKCAHTNFRKFQNPWWVTAASLPCPTQPSSECNKREIAVPKPNLRGFLHVLRT